MNRYKLIAEHEVFGKIIKYNISEKELEKIYQQLQEDDYKIKLQLLTNY